MKKYKITLKEAGIIVERVVFATSAYEAENLVINKMVAEYKWHPDLMEVLRLKQI